MYPVGKKNRSNGLDIYTRTPSLINNSACPSNLVSINSIQYDNYVKGNNMTIDDTCDTNIVTIEDVEKLNNLEKQLAVLGEKINIQTNTLHNNNTNINNSMTSGANTMNKDFKMYYQVKAEINKLLEKRMNKQDKKNIKKITGNNMLEAIPMKEGLLNMNDLNAMKTDSDLIVLQNNYQYILWSIVAVGILIVTINTIKK